VTPLNFAAGQVSLKSQGFHSDSGCETGPRSMNLAHYGSSTASDKSVDLGSYNLDDASPSLPHDLAKIIGQPRRRESVMDHTVVSFMKVGTESTYLRSARQTCALARQRSNRLRSGGANLICT